MNQEQKLAQLAAEQMEARRKTPPARCAQSRRLQLDLHWEYDAEGAVALFGLSREPIILTPEQWEVLFEHCEQLRDFIGQSASQPPRFWEDG